MSPTIRQGHLGYLIASSFVGMVASETNGESGDGHLSRYDGARAASRASPQASKYSIRTIVPS
jgi:hypothetical protein